MATHATRQNESTMDKIKDKLHIGSHSCGTNDSYNTRGTAEGISGLHNTRTANALAPCIDSDRDNSANTGATAEDVSGPHGSRVANALGPRVDSDRGNSATLGSTNYGSTREGTASYTTETTTDDVSGPHNRKQHIYSVVPDATKMTPSQFASHAGEPEILHDDKNHDRILRNSMTTNQERLSGI